MEPIPSSSGQPHWPSSSFARASSNLEVESTEYRVGAPAPLQPPSLRFEIHKPSERLVAQFEGDFDRKAAAVLEKHGLDYDDINFCIFGCLGDHHELTLRIISCWLPGLASTWENIVAELKRHVDGELEKAGFLGLANVVVEIIDPWLVKPKNVGPILGNKLLEDDWPIIQEKVFSILESWESTKGAINTISIFRFGRSNDNSENPITVYISLDPGTPDSTWPQVSSSIQAYLDTLPHELKVHMEHNTVDFLASEL